MTCARPACAGVPARGCRYCCRRCAAWALTQRPEARRELLARLERASVKRRQGFARKQIAAWRADAVRVLAMVDAGRGAGDLERAVVEALHAAYLTGRRLERNRAAETRSREGRRG